MVLRSDYHNTVTRNNLPNLFTLLAECEGSVVLEVNHGKHEISRNYVPKIDRSRSTEHPCLQET